MYHKVTGNTFALNDAKGTVRSSGTLFGPDWKWTYFKATYESTNGARIEDENFMTDQTCSWRGSGFLDPMERGSVSWTLRSKALPQQPSRSCHRVCSKRPKERAPRKSNDHAA